MSGCKPQHYLYSAVDAAAVAGAGAAGDRGRVQLAGATVGAIQFLLVLPELGQSFNEVQRGVYSSASERKVSLTVTLHTTWIR